MKCQLCGTQEATEKKLRVAHRPILDRKSNIVDIIWTWEPVCNGCFYFFSRPKKVPKKWIERIMETQFIDGRQRIVDLVLVPYLVNERGMNSEKVLGKILEWFRLCNYQKRGEEYVRSQIKYVKRKGLKTLSYNKFCEYGFDKFKGDIYEK